MFDALLTVRFFLDGSATTKNAHYIAVIKKNRRIKRHCKQYVYVYRARRDCICPISGWAAFRQAARISRPI